MNQVEPDNQSSTSEPTSRAKNWANTMAGFDSSGAVVDAHRDSEIRIHIERDFDRPTREKAEEELNLAAARSEGGGAREIQELPDPYRTCFEKDRDRILHSAAFRRLAGKTQVFIFPRDHQRTRLTHALEVSQVARAISKRLGLNQDLTEAIALGHDCGHGPGGHASEDALSVFLEGGYDHATVGADQVLSKLNLCKETLDGVRNHSWNRPEPSSAEGLVVSWADRIAYCAHDLEDAASTGIIKLSDVPEEVRDAIGPTRSIQLDFFINSVVGCARETGRIAMYSEPAHYLSELRRFNYNSIYLRPESLRQSELVISVLRNLVEYLHAHHGLASELLDRPEAKSGAVSLEDIALYVGGMTDRYAFTLAREVLGLKDRSMPMGIDLLT